MRVIRALVPADARNRVVDRLDEEGIDHVLFGEQSNQEDDLSLVEFPIPTEGVEYALELLRDEDVDDRYTVILTAETAETTHFEDLEQRFVAENEDDDSIAHEEIRQKAIGMNPGALTYYAMTLLSAVVATAGLLLDSPAIVVGSMVIAPQVGSALTTSVGTVFNDRGMIVRGLRSQLFGLAAAVVGATAFGLLLRHAAFIPTGLNVISLGQVSQRVSPGLLSITVAICAGSAGAFGLATALPVSLVGVMIAAALIPAAAAVGIGIAWSNAAIAVGAFVLLLVNAASINLAAVTTFWLLDYRPVESRRDDAPAPSFRRFVPAVAAVAVLVLAFVGAGVAMNSQMQYSNDVNSAVENVLDREAYEDLDLRGVNTEFVEVGPFGERGEVTVTVARPVGAAHPDLAEELRDEIADTTGRSVSVEVEYVDHQRAPPDDESADRRIVA